MAGSLSTKSTSSPGCTSAEPARSRRYSRSRKSNAAVALCARLVSSFLEQEDLPLVRGDVLLLKEQEASQRVDEALELPPLIEPPDRIRMHVQPFCRLGRPLHL